MSWVKNGETYIGEVEVVINLIQVADGQAGWVFRVFIAEHSVHLVCVVPSTDECIFMR